MKLVYFHGFASSGASGTAQLLAKLFPSGEVIAPDIPLDPDEALPFLTELVKKEQPDIIIGTSMGGMYAQQMRGVLRICVNPAFQMSSLSKVLHTGTFKWLNGRKNHEKEFKVTHEILQHFRAMERHQFDGITEADTWFPAFEAADWKKTAETSFEPDEKNKQRFSFCTYERQPQRM